MAVAPSERAPGAAGLGEAAGENMEAPPRLEATLELTLLRDWQTCQVSGGWTAGPGCHLLQPWDRHLLESEWSQRMSWPPAPFPYKFFMAHISVFQAYFRPAPLVQPKSSLLQSSGCHTSGQKSVCYNATLLTFGCQNLELLWLLTAWNSSTEFSGTS